MANKITVLDGLVASKIAAGEVIERPASVVKELLENAIDARATSISLRIEAGGRDLIKVVDNGCGIDAGDAPLAIMRHATSKIGAEEDLLGVKTLGFRGEALASIAAVSRLTITTREHGAAAGARLAVEGGGEPSIEPAGCSEGTSVEVRDLFFNTPVRLKFLRSAGTESGRITDVFKTLALVNPAVRFSLGRDRGRDLILPVCTLRERLATLSALDNDRESQLTEIVSPHIEGYIGAPEQSYATAKALHTYLNGRPIKDRAVLRALIDGYGRLLPGGRYPLAILNLKLPPSDVDVNIHPAKTEVRFKNPGAVYSLVRDAVRKALSEKGTHVSPAPVYYGSAPGAEGSLPVTRETGRDYYKSPGEQAKHAPVPEGLFSRKMEKEVRNPEFLGLRIRGQLWDEFLLAESFGGGEGGAENIFYLIDQHGAEERHAFSRLKKAYYGAGIESQLLLIPERVETTAEESESLRGALPRLGQCGFEITPFG
ncbi:MAG: DNA mismatch repair endonuclease MutL, partial [Thermodesulfobacteriota bacterium]